MIRHTDPQTIEPASASIGQVNKKNFLSLEPKPNKVGSNKRASKIIKDPSNIKIRAQETASRETPDFADSTQQETKSMEDLEVE